MHTDFRLRERIPARAANTNEKSSVQERRRVLIIDDSAEIRKLLTRLCSSIPRLNVIGEAKDGIEGLTAIRKLKPDVVTLDIRMPNLNGLDLLKALRVDACPCTIIVITGMTEEIYRQKCIEFGAHYVFHKGTELDGLFKVLRSL